MTIKTFLEPTLYGSYVSYELDVLYRRHENDELFLLDGMTIDLDVVLLIF